MIETRSQFFYGHTITDVNFQLSFNEGSGEILGELNVGSYSLDEFVDEIARVLNEFGTFTYTATVDRITRLITIVADSAFDLLTGTASSGTTCFDLMGFDSPDKTGLLTYDGDNASGQVWQPQQVPQSYVTPDDLKNPTQVSINETGTGKVEVVTFGSIGFYEMRFPLVSDIDQGIGGPIENNNSAVSEARQFLSTVINKGTIEFMPDRDSPDTFDQVILESTRENKDGVGFRLKELYSRKLPGYFDTEMLKFRKIVS